MNHYWSPLITINAMKSPLITINHHNWPLFGSEYPSGRCFFTNFTNSSRWFCEISRPLRAQGRCPWTKQVLCKRDRGPRTGHIYLSHSDNLSNLANVGSWSMSLGGKYRVLVFQGPGRHIGAICSTTSGPWRRWKLSSCYCFSDHSDTTTPKQSVTNWLVLKLDIYIYRHIYIYTHIYTYVYIYIYTFI